MVRNIGGGIAIFGIMIGTGLTQNYLLLIFLIIPIFTWLFPDEKVKQKTNELYFKKQSLEIQKLEEELKSWRYTNMIRWKKDFEKWFDYHFCNQQGEDSPYAYDDVVEAFKAGKKSKK